MGTMNAVTGAFGYTGQHITRLLLSRGQRVLNLTNHPNRPNPFGQEVGTAPLCFNDPDALAGNMRGADTLYNTYWIRFAHGASTFEQAVANSRALIRAAEEAGVRRIVHLSITQADERSPLPYFKGKALVEEAIKQSTLTHAILRPTVIYGPGDILINNIAWCLRKFPVFAIPGDGRCRLQPIFVEDMAALAVEAGQRPDNITMDAVGPETFTFDELVRLVARSIGSRARIIHVPPALSLLMSRMVGLMVGDVILTPDEVKGLLADLLVSGDAPTGTTRLSDWLRENATVPGQAYASELARHYKLNK